MCKAQTPFLNRDREEVTQHCQFDANCVVGFSLCQMMVPVRCRKLAAQCGHRVLAEVADQVLGRDVLTPLSGWLLGWRYLGQVPLQRFLKRHALGTSPRDVNATNHLIFGSAGPIDGVAFESESLGSGRPASHANKCFVGAEGVRR